MSQEHTIVVHFPDGVVPRYVAAIESQGGKVVGVDSDGNRLRIAQELEEALDKVMHCKYFVLLSGAVQHEVSAALAKARGDS